MKQVTDASQSGPECEVSTSETCVAVGDDLSVIAHRVS
jgi:hypothetical protein